MIVELQTVLNVAKSAFELLNTIKKILPEKENKTLTQEIKILEENFELANVSLAKELDYPLCQCTYPPQIMTLKGSHGYIYECSQCNREIDNSGYHRSIA